MLKFKKSVAVAAIAAIGMAGLSAQANQADRRALMKDVGGAAKGLRTGTMPPAEAGAKLAMLASQIPAVFEENEITGDSKALPAIWENFDDFTAKAKMLEDAANALVDAANNGGDVAAAGQAIGGTCGACHKAYQAPS
jgi:cytochrome c556